MAFCRTIRKDIADKKIDFRKIYYPSNENFNYISATLHEKYDNNKYYLLRVEVSGTSILNRKIIISYLIARVIQYIKKDIIRNISKITDDKRALFYNKL